MRTLSLLGEDGAIEHPVLSRSLPHHCYDPVRVGDSTLNSYHDPKGLILITTTDGKTYGISPAEPERFLEELETRRRQAHPQ
jgi:hypothetical protein